MSSLSAFLDPLALLFLGGSLFSLWLLWIVLRKPSTDDDDSWYESATSKPDKPRPGGGSGSGSGRKRDRAA